MSLAMEPEAIRLEEKREALERVLASRTFSRSERLRAFLRFVCEAEFEGRAQQINEYALGVSVLGRPPGFSPAEDSAVRTRAYELRNKLRIYFESEGAGDPLRIEIDKGGYVPRFVRKEKSVLAEPTPAADGERPSVAPEPPPAPAVGHAAPASPPKRRLGTPVGAAIALLAVLAALFVATRNREPRSERGLRGVRANRTMQALWKPFEATDVPLLISFEKRLFFYAPGTGLVVRDYQTNEPDQVAKSKPLLAFQRQMSAPELQERFDYADFGAVHAAFLLGQLLDREVGIKDSSSLGWQDIWNSNLIFLGKPNLNPSIRYSLQGKDFAEGEYGSGIRNLHPLAGEPELYPNPEAHGSGEKYGLISVLPGPQPGRRMMILSGSAAELMWALAEAVTNPIRVEEIFSHVLLPSGEFPAAFQVVIAATFESNVPLKIRYVTHRVSGTSEPAGSSAKSD